MLCVYAFRCGLFTLRWLMMMVMPCFTFPTHTPFELFKAQPKLWLTMLLFRLYSLTHLAFNRISTKILM